MQVGMNWNQLDRTRKRGFYGCAALMVKCRIFPSSLRRGGCAIKKESRSILSSRRRCGVQPQQNSAKFDEHLVRGIKEVSRYCIDAEVSPPRKGGENDRTQCLYDRASETPESVR